MASVNQTDITTTTADFSQGTLTDVVAEKDGLYLAAPQTNPVIYYHDFTSIGGWVSTGGSNQGITSIENYPAGRGGKVADCNASSSTSWIYDSSAVIPYDPTKLYEITGKVRQTIDNTNAACYIGINGIAADGVTKINTNGLDDYGSQHYFAVSSDILKVAEGWRIYRGYFTGHSTSKYGQQNDPSDPGAMYTGVEYIQPLVILNYSGGSGSAQIDYVQIREITSLPNYALNSPVSASNRIVGNPLSIITDGSRVTTTYTSVDTVEDAYVTIDLGEPKPLRQIGVWHYYSDGRTYYGTKTQISSGESYYYKYPTSYLDYTIWSIGSSGSQGVFSANGISSENVIVERHDPFGLPTAVWECRPDSSSNADGGWNALWNGDHTKTYRMSVWVRKTVNLTEGTTYLGCENTGSTRNLSGTVNNNPYFWYGDLPALDQWYLMVGVIHASDYGGGYSGISGIYNSSGSKVISGTDFKWTSGATTQEMRAYLYYTTVTSTRQEFVYPRVDLMDGTEPTIGDLASSFVWRTVFDSSDSGTYTELSNGRGHWIGVDDMYARYIRDRTSGNTANSADHWVEIEAYGDPILHTTGNRTKQLSLADAGRITSSTISWYDHTGPMLGNGSYGISPYDPSLVVPDMLTIEAWVYWHGQTQNDIRGTIFTVASSYYMQVMDDGQVSVYTYWKDGSDTNAGNSAYTDSTSSINRNEWTHIAYTEDTSGLRKIYINGILDKTEQKEATIVSAARYKNEGIGIGMQQGFSRDFFGSIRNCRLWAYDRTESEIQNNMYTALTGSETGLIGCWPMDEGSGNMSYDIGPNALDIEWFGATRWLTTQVETNVSLDNGATWQGWKVVNNGDSIPDIPFDSDGRKSIVDCRLTLNQEYSEGSPSFSDLTISVDGKKTLTKAWTGTAWVDAIPKYWNGSQWVECETRVGVDGRWL